MVKREQYTISLNEEEAEKIKKFAETNGETFSGFIRREILKLVNKGD